MEEREEERRKIIKQGKEYGVKQERKNIIRPSPFHVKVIHHSAVEVLTRLKT